MGENLKPCPFCGSRALYEIYQTIDGFEVPVMFCDMCKAMFTVEGAEDWVTGERDGMDELRSAWNTRAERTCQIVKTWSDSDYVDGWRYRCSECCCFIPVNERDQDTGDVISAANYCPNCGAKVVDA